ncbi:MAG: ATP-dependent DNA helicase RecQ [Bacteroidota bacterium]
MQNIHQILKLYWGFDKFRPLQEEIIKSILTGNDTLALLPTGGGKSICFQLPALTMEGLCLVISPLIALMKDQVYNLNKKGIKAVAIYSGLPPRQIDTLLDNCVYGNIKFLYISPERLASKDFLVRMEKMKITLLAVDEAHCISQWGYDFRPPYLKIAEVRDKLKSVPVIALTATATPEVVEDIQEKLLFRKKNVLQKSFVRKNLSYVVRQSINKEKAMLDILTKVNGTAVVYIRNRKKTKQYSDFLNKQKIKADFYHAGLQPNERSRKQDEWINNKTRVICCTNAFGMGIDKPDVRIVIHMDLAESIEAYFQEAGRAGRDEKKAYAVQLIEPSDIVELDKKIKEGYLSIDFIKDVYDSLCIYLRLAYNSGIDQSFDFDLGLFSETYQLNPVKILSALKVLEQHELIYVTDAVYSLSQIKAKADKDVIARFIAENKNQEALVKFILRTSEGIFDDYVSIDEQTIAPRLKIKMSETVKQLQTLEKFGIFQYQPRKNKPQIIFLQNRIMKKDLRLDRSFIEKRKLDLEKRLKAVRYYVTENNCCRTRLLVKYFGETNTDDCGICDVCVARKKSGLSTEKFFQVVIEIEKELSNAPLALEQLNSKLKIKKEELKTAIDFLSDAGRIERNHKGEILLVK